MSALFSIISPSQILILPWYIQMAGGLLIAWHLFCAFKFLLDRAFLAMSVRLIGIWVVLIFMTVGGRLYPVWSGEFAL